MIVQMFSYDWSLNYRSLVIQFGDFHSFAGNFLSIHVAFRDNFFSAFSGTVVYENQRFHMFSIFLQLFLLSVNDFSRRTFAFHDTSIIELFACDSRTFPMPRSNDFFPTS